MLQKVRETYRVARESGGDNEDSQVHDSDFRYSLIKKRLGSFHTFYLWVCLDSGGSACTTTGRAWQETCYLLGGWKVGASIAGLAVLWYVACYSMPCWHTNAYVYPGRDWVRADGGHIYKVSCLADYPLLKL